MYSIEKKLFQKFTNLTILFVLTFATAAIADDAIIGKIAVINGKVTIKSASGTSKSANPGDTLANNDVVNTEAGASAKLLFTDQSIIDLGANSSFKVSDYALKSTDNRTGTFSLLFGKMRSLVTKKVGDKGKVQYKVGNSVMGVRGTEFVIDAPKGANGAVSIPKLVVVSGIVAVGNISGAAPVLVKQGEALTANFGAAASAPSGTGGAAGATGPSQTSENAPTVQKVSSSEMQSVVSSSKAVDNTFDAAVTIKPAESNSEKGSSEKGSNEKGEGGQGKGGEKSSGGNLALATVQSVVGASVTAQTEQSAKQEMKQPPPEFINRNGSFLPPVNLVPGGLVHLSVGVIK